jgi:hypothetical protein
MSGNARWNDPIPDSLANRLQLEGNVVYALPGRLLDLVETHLLGAIGKPDIDDAREVARLANERLCVAFRNKELVQYQFLAEGREPITAELLRKAGSKFAEHIADQASNTVSQFFRYTQAYFGWLFNQDEYWSDLDMLIADESEEEALLTAPKPAIFDAGKFTVAESGHAMRIQNYKTFFSKWRLQTLATFDLPVCLAPQLTETTVYNSGAPEGTINPVIPDIFPIDGQGRVSAALESAGFSLDAPHLESWKEISSSSSRKKKRVDTYCRQFVLQHYWRTITQRYAEQLNRKVNQLDAVFGAFFDVSVDMIRADRKELGDHLRRPLINR